MPGAAYVGGVNRGALSTLRAMFQRVQWLSAESVIRRRGEESDMLTISTLGRVSIGLDWESVTGLASRKVEPLLVCVTSGPTEY